MKKKHIITSALSLALLFSSCGKYLDKYPDNRMYNRQNEASGTKGTKRTKLKLLRRNEAYA